MGAGMESRRQFRCAACLMAPALVRPHKRRSKTALQDFGDWVKNLNVSRETQNNSLYFC